MGFYFALYSTIITRQDRALPRAELYLRTIHLLCPYVPDNVLISWVEQFLKNANYRLDLAADT